MNKTPVALLIALAALTSGCAPDSPDPAPQPSSTASVESAPAGDEATSSQSANPAPVDQLPASAPTAVTTLPFTIQLLGTNQGKPVVLSIASVTTSATATRLVYWTSSRTPVTAARALDPTKPELYPTLTDPATRTVYRIDTWKDAKGLPQCFCSQPSDLTTTTAHPADASYPPLPEGVSQVSITIPGATGSVTVPVTRR